MIAIYIVIGLAAIVLVVGLMMPRNVTVERAVTIDRPAAVIFPWAADFKLWPQWTVWNTSEDTTLAYTYPGPTTGKGGAMHWTAKKMGDGSATFTEFETEKLLAYELRMPAHNTVVRGRIELESAGAGATRVTWLDEIDMGGNPLKKCLGPLLKVMLGKAFARNLAGLRTAAETGKASGPGPK